MVDYDAFVRDIKTNKTIRVSLKSDGTEADPANNQDNKTPVISADGRFVAFTADQYGAFTPGDKNNQFDVYVHNMTNGQTRRVSVKSSGYEAKGASGSGSERPLAISADGQSIAFESYARLANNDTNSERDVYLRDQKAATTRRISIKPNGGQVTTGGGGQQLPAISGDGNWVAFQTIGTVLPGAAEPTSTSSCAARSVSYSRGRLCP